MPNNTLLEVKDLKMYFENKKGFLGKNRVCKSRTEFPSKYKREKQSDW